MLGYRVNTANFLRLWKAEACESFDFHAFNVGDYYRAVDEKIVSENVTKVLYPNDGFTAGRELRLQQQYFFVSCALQDMIRLYRQREPLLAEQQRDNTHEAWDQPSGVQGEPADWSHMPDESLLRLELRQAVAAAIRDLPEIYREPIILRDLEGLTTEEASTRLKLKDETLKSRLHRGRLLLRERLRVFASGLTLHRPTTAYS